MNGQQLVSDYQTALVTAATAEAATFQANQSETDLLSHLDDLSSGRFLHPSAIAGDEQAYITRASLDAHFKKVQAQQMQTMSLTQLQQLGEQDQQTYVGRKVRVTVVGGAKDVIELVTFDPQRGYESHSFSRRNLTAVIETVALDKNVLVLRPTFSMRLLNSRLQNYLVYVIDPGTFEPLITVQTI